MKKYNNIVVESKNPQHGAKIIEAWKKLGVITSLQGDGSYNCYYGYVNDVFDNHNIEDCKRFQAKIITLEELEALVSDNKIITYLQAQDIIDIACSTWQNNLSLKWGVTIVLKKEIHIHKKEYEEMRKACTLEQHKLFDDIFGAEPKFKKGDWVVWTGCEPAVGQIVNNSGEYWALDIAGRPNSHSNCNEKHLRLATQEEIHKAKNPPLTKGTPCLVRDDETQVWKLYYADGENKFFVCGRKFSGNSVSWNHVTPINLTEVIPE